MTYNTGLVWDMRGTACAPDDAEHIGRDQGSCAEAGSACIALTYEIA